MDSSDALHVPHSREVFYTGGEYTVIPDNPSSSTTTSQYMLNQIYVEKLTPLHPTASRPYPLIFIPGAGQTGTNFLDTPDGRPGWANFFLSHGYTVYLTDQPSRGRSPWHPSVGSMHAFSTADLEKLFTACASHDLWPRSRTHAQWPGTGKAGDPIFDRFFASQVQYQADRKISEAQNASAYTKLMDEVGEAYLVTHSQAGPYGWRVGDARPHLVKGIVALEPGGPPFENKFPQKSGRVRIWGITDLEVEYDPSAGPNAEFLETVRIRAKDSQCMDYLLQKEPAKTLKNLSQVPVLVVTAEASYHAPYDYGTVAYLRQAGVQVEHMELWEQGIRGNGHMFFMERNNFDIAERVLRWLNEH